MSLKCKIFLSVILSVPTFSWGVAANTFLSQVEYVKQCESQGIVIPETFDCNAGEELPVYRSQCDDKGAVVEKLQITVENNNALNFRGDCDSPALVQQYNPQVACLPGARIQLITQPQGNSVCALVCRRTNNLTPIGRFQDMSLLCHNPDNGATCFFNSKVELIPPANPVEIYSHAGSHILKPGANADTVWMQPKELDAATCTRCHDKSPFLITPNLGKFGKTLREKSKTSPFGKYFVVGDALPFTHPVWKKRLVLDSPTNRCTSCHRMGTGSFGGCGHLRDSAVGKNSVLPKTSCGYERGWMPPQGHGALSTYQKDIAEIIACCRDWDGEGNQVSNHCKWKEIP